MYCNDSRSTFHFAFVNGIHSIITRVRHRQSIYIILKTLHCCRQFFIKNFKNKDYIQTYYSNRRNTFHLTVIVFDFNNFFYINDSYIYH